MKRKVFLLFVASFLMFGNIYAETIVFKSGKKVDAKILDKTDEWIEIDLEGVRITYFLSDIDTIDGQKVGASAKEVAPAVVQPKEQAQQLKDETPVLTTPTITQEKVQFRSPQEEKMALAAMGVFAIIILIVVIVSYIYGAICLYFIAKKTDTTPAWLAWVPIANLFLMCNIAQISYLWLLLVLTFWIPFVGFFASLGFTGYIWYKIALARNKPGWLGILVCIPLAGLIIMGYLAFSGSETSVEAATPESTAPPQTTPPTAF